MLDSTAKTMFDMTKPSLRAAEEDTGINVNILALVKEHIIREVVEKDCQRFKVRSVD
jgi:hypothetical protein